MREKTTQLVRVTQPPWCFFCICVCIFFLHPSGNNFVPMKFIDLMLIWFLKRAFDKKKRRRCNAAMWWRSWFVFYLPHCTVSPSIVHFPIDREWEPLCSQCTGDMVHIKTLPLTVRIVDSIANGAHNAFKWHNKFGFSATGFAVFVQMKFYAKIKKFTRRVKHLAEWTMINVIQSEIIDFLYSKWSILVAVIHITPLL